MSSLSQQVFIYHCLWGAELSHICASASLTGPGGDHVPLIMMEPEAAPTRSQLQGSGRLGPLEEGHLGPLEAALQQRLAASQLQLAGREVRPEAEGLGDLASDEVRCYGPDNGVVGWL